MSQTAVTATGTIASVSPRSPNKLTEQMVRKLQAAKQRDDEAHEALLAVVREALQQGSVRQVAKALGMSPTTIQKWNSER